MKETDGRKGYELSTLYETLGVPSTSSDVKRAKEVLAEWCQKEPDSHIPWQIKGEFFIAEAWKARGYGFSKTVSDRGWIDFKKSLELAQVSFEKAQALNPADPNSSSRLIVIAYGSSQPREVMEKHFNIGVKHNPGHFRLHSNKLEYLLPRWGNGSALERDKFADECYKLKDKYPYVGFIKVMALVDEDSYHRKEKKSFLGRIDVWPIVESGYNQLLSMHPDDLRRRSFYANQAYRCGRNEVAYNQFKIIGDRWLLPLTGWSNLPLYHKYRALCYYSYAKKLQNSIKGRLNKKRFEVLKKATAIFEESLALDPTGKTYYLLAIAQWNSAKFLESVPILKKAHENLMEAVRLMPDNESTRKHLQQMREGFKKRLGIKESWMTNYME